MKTLKKVSQDEQARLLDQFTAESAKFIREENNYKDYTDSVFDLLTELAESVQEEFKWLIRALSKIFALLLNTNISNIDKIKRILKIAIEMTLKI